METQGGTYPAGCVEYIMFWYKLHAWKWGLTDMTNMIHIIDDFFFFFQIEALHPGKETRYFPCTSRAAFGLQSNTGRFDTNTCAFVQFQHIWRDTIWWPQHHPQSWEQTGEVERKVSARACPRTHAQAHSHIQSNKVTKQCSLTASCSDVKMRPPVLPVTRRSSDEKTKMASERRSAELVLLLEQEWETGNASLAQACARPLAPVFILSFFFFLWVFLVYCLLPKASTACASCFWVIQN